MAACFGRPEANARRQRLGQVRPAKTKPIADQMNKDAGSGARKGR